MVLKSMLLLYIYILDLNILYYYWCTESISIVCFICLFFFLVREMYIINITLFVVYF